MDKQESTIIRWISILYRYGQSYVSKQMEGYAIGSGQYSILMALFKKGGVSQEELVEHLRIDKGSIAKAVKKLEKEGYVERRVNPDDRRAFNVYPTQKANDTFPVIRQAARDWESLITSDLTDEEKQLVEKILQKMAKRACSMKYSIEENENEKKAGL